MAKVLGKKLDIPVVRLLKRKKRTKFQLKLTKSSRQENVKNAFCICKKSRDNLSEIIQDKNIIIIDDLCTTGATLKNMSITLLKKGGQAPRSISALVACRRFF
jgi:predicted amidophosphoribosyltransferase